MKCVHVTIDSSWETPDNVRDFGLGGLILARST